MWGFSVNLVRDEGLRGIAIMGANPQNPEWSANKAIDGNTDQRYVASSCAITDFTENHNTTIWWKVWLMRKFNVAYLEIYFRSDSMEYLTCARKKERERSVNKICKM